MKNTKSTLFAVFTIVIITIVGYFIYQNSSKTNVGVIKIGYLVPTLENPFFVNMTNGAKSKSNSKLEVLVQASPDELKQNQIIENYITQGVDAICVVPINSETIIPAIIKANKAGIPVINVDNKINMESANKQGAKIAFYIGSDNFDGGKLAGQFIIERLKGKGKVAILEGVAGNDAAIKRKGGFMKAISDTKDIQVVASQAADWNRQKANDIFQAILTANPDLKAVFACNDEMALGAIAAMKNKGIDLNTIVVVGFDAVDEAIKAVELGELNATIAQQPELMGRKAIELVQSLLAGQKINESYSTPLKVVE